MAANEHVLDGQSTSELCHTLGPKEILHKVRRGQQSNTHIDGKIPIDGVWASRGLKIGGFIILSFAESVGDHCTFIFDVTTRSLIGKYKHRVVRAGCRRLNTKKNSLAKNNATLESQMDVHRMYNRMKAIVSAIEDDRPNPASNSNPAT